MGWRETMKAHEPSPQYPHYPQKPPVREDSTDFTDITDASGVSFPMVTGEGFDADGSIVALKIDSPLVGAFWFCLSDTEPFDPGDGLPVYRPSEVRALVGKGYGPEALQAVHRAKVIFEGSVVVKITRK